jgi:hypothetical protein
MICRKRLEDASFEECVSILRMLPKDLKEEELFRTVKKIDVPPAIDTFIRRIEREGSYSNAPAVVD